MLQEVSGISDGSSCFSAMPRAAAEGAADAQGHRMIGGPVTSGHRGQLP
jgi:hypothetical protein